MADVVMALLSDRGITKLKAQPDWEAFRESSAGKPVVLLFSSKSKVTPLYKSLSMRFKDRLAFAQVGPP